MSSVQYEVELKFRLTDFSMVMQRLLEWGAVKIGIENQVDQYFAHPVRDFAETDEALRIRSVGNVNRLTYKGPVIDLATKTREESELNFAPGPESAEQLAHIWELLGFRRVRVVRKGREIYKLQRDGRELEICLDHVESLGRFLEIEMVVDAAHKSDAQQAILALAQELNLGSAERRSYLEMIITGI